ncbi:hypothetical protein GCM10009657_23280 [Oryzihumus leptocrescens]
MSTAGPDPFHDGSGPAYCRQGRDRAGPTTEPTMSDKSPRHTMSKKSGKSIKEKRAEKKAKASTETSHEFIAGARKR